MIRRNTQNVPSERVPAANVVVGIVVVLVDGAHDVVAHHRCETTISFSVFQPFEILTCHSRTASILYTKVTVISTSPR